MSAPRNNKRGDRVGDTIHRELAELLRGEVKDPRLHGLTITQVDVTPDLAHAKIFVSHRDGVAAWPDAEKSLQKAGGFLRSQVARVLNTYSVPTLKFVYDQSLERGIEISSLIDQAVAEDKKHPSDE